MRWGEAKGKPHERAVAETVRRSLRGHPDKPGTLSQGMKRYYVIRIYRRSGQYGSPAMGEVVIDRESLSVECRGQAVSPAMVTTQLSHPDSLDLIAAWVRDLRHTGENHASTTD